MENNTSKSILELYKQYLFGKVCVEETNKGRSLCIECRQCKEGITYESDMVFDMTEDKPVLIGLSLEVNNYALDNEVLFVMKSNTDTYIHDTLMTILDVVLTKSLKVEGIIYSKYGSTKE